MSDNAALLARREKLLGRNMSTFYNDPVHLVKGEGVWVWDADGRKYLDCYNNVPHVGHCHPRVVEAITRQASMLNTHTRYLHEGILDYVERLTATFDASLDTAILEYLGDGRTRLTVTSLVDSLEARDMMLASGMESGVNEGYEKLDELLAQQD